MMNSFTKLSSVIGWLPVAALLGATAVFGQPPSTPGSGTSAPQSSSSQSAPATIAIHPFGNPTPEQGGLGRPSWLPAEPSVPAFPGAVLYNDRPQFLAGVKVNHADLSYVGGETLSVEFTAEREAYLYLLYHQADGTSYLLFPNEAHPDNRVPARQWQSVPGPGEEFRFRVTAPYGTEVLQVVAALRPVEELDALVKKIGRAAPVSQEVINRAHDRLSGDLSTWTEHRVAIRTAASSSATVARGARRVGLFVGVNKFQTSEKQGEGGNARFRLGAEMMARFMLQRGGLDSQWTKTLTGEEATRANIETAITRWLPSVTRPGDTVFIFYGGHGGLIKNLDGTKPDGKDGVLTTYNNAFQAHKLTDDEWDAQARQNFISDITLARWLQELPGRQIAVLISSCHAGSMIDAGLLARFGSREATRVKGISAVNVAVLASCAADEETLSQASKPVFLAQYLCEAMEKLPAPVTLQQAFDYYRQASRARLQQVGEVGFHEPVLTDTALLPIVLAP
jgi:hypothetical protein